MIFKNHIIDIGCFPYTPSPDLQIDSSKLWSYSSERVRIPFPHCRVGCVCFLEQDLEQCLDICPRKFDKKGVPLEMLGPDYRFLPACAILS